MSKLLIACGGTGGHLAPGIALAEELQGRGHECVLLISQKEVDSALTRKYSHLNFVKTPGMAFAGGLGARLRSVWSMLSACLFARRLLRDEKPQLVFLFGGFLSVGLGFAARITGVPVALHEANCRPGKAVRLIKRLAHRVYLPDGLRLKGLSRNQVRYLGYPIRQDIKHILKAEAWKKLKIEVPNKLLVVIGGSQGAAALNDWVTRAFPELAQAGITVYCVTGLGKSALGTIHEVGANGEDISATFVPFSESMGDVLSAADLVISRAGAGAIAEIIHCRAPSILVPYPYAADDHQMANALVLEQYGACLVVPEAESGTLIAEVKDLMFNDWMLSQFKSNLARLDRFNSSKKIAADLEFLISEADARTGSAGKFAV
ncbi:UDP-N-acetylglucosamine--N-acetylmuramyl-(pentapeptide) pyrophosphoryl-undecaprenol N-acetylglucosamine transferase [Coraliomargarita parva]|uniref:UDP-N-acetylglucosamine--N-acetylmuramyl- (pentapeptide) pyrophosphoryl-undecaprenol N-acetylglucosamine transferase n=1 Tax=Coraliomargarita parva TaxID=3014050 RepID=UPI0022B41657|nr:UDP-N-acetylglucosamine--N-acetylmuramyl-(pentapeptide) pyrophosphoryl-undecaprenol N-acetylglucosamine transferase [Coraliomargarita parva]